MSTHLHLSCLRSSSTSLSFRSLTSNEQWWQSQRRFLNLLSQLTQTNHWQKTHHKRKKGSHLSQSQQLGRQEQAITATRRINVSTFSRPSPIGWKAERSTHRTSKRSLTSTRNHWWIEKDCGHFSPQGSRLISLQLHTNLFRTLASSLQSLWRMTSRSPQRVWSSRTPSRCQTPTLSLTLMERSTRWLLTSMWSLSQRRKGWHRKWIASTLPETSTPSSFLTDFEVSKWSTKVREHPGTLSASLRATHWKPLLSPRALAYSAYCRSVGAEVHRWSTLALPRSRSKTSKLLRSRSLTEFHSWFSTQQSLWRTSINSDSIQRKDQRREEERQARRLRIQISQSLLLSIHPMILFWKIDD